MFIFYLLIIFCLYIYYFFLTFDDDITGHLIVAELVAGAHFVSARVTGSGVVNDQRYLVFIGEFCSDP